MRTDPQVVIKTIELSPSLYERCVLPDAYSEVLMLERYKVRGQAVQVQGCWAGTAARIGVAGVLGVGSSQSQTIPGSILGLFDPGS